MFANFRRSRARRRGVVLVLVLGMLGLLALIGVTFTTFSGQAQINARNFAQAQNWPDSAEMMDFALAQLINDTDNPQSAIRGHSLKRDMYGNDAMSNAAFAADPVSGAAMAITAVGQIPVTTNGPTLVRSVEIDGGPRYICVNGLYKLVTNIPVNAPGFYGYHFSRWILRVGPSFDTSLTPAAFYVGQTLEILAEDLNDSTGFRVFYVAPWDGSYATPNQSNFVVPTPTPPTPPLPNFEQTQPTTLESPTRYSQAPTIPYPLPSDFTLGTGQRVPMDYYNSPEGTGQSQLFPLATNATSINVPFILDGRYLHAFNGPGMSALDANLNGQASGAVYRVNRGMAQYANFRVNGNIVDSAFSNGINATPPVTRAAYGYPNQIAGMDEDYDACDLENWFLALQSADGQIMVPSFHRPGILIYDPSLLDPVTQRAPYDDWESDNIFSASKILRPRAADGHSRAAFPNLYPDANGKVTYDVDNDGDGTTDSVWLDLGYPPKRSATGQLYKPMFAFMVIGLNGRIPLNTAGNLQLRDLNGVALAQHASGKGTSPSELDPSYALQNAVPNTLGTDNAQADNAGQAISLTQLRNILAGARMPGAANGDSNTILVNSAAVTIPNGVGDPNDVYDPTTGNVSTLTEPVPGRWGEADQMPTQLNINTVATTVGPSFNYFNSVRAGLSGRVYPGAPPANGYDDARDDNYNTFDVYPRNSKGATAPTSPGPFVPASSTNAYASAVVVTTLGENGDYYDASGSMSMPVERIRRFVTPIDAAGDGWINTFSAPAGPPLGFDNRGRVAYFKHFRPPGMPITLPPGLILFSDNDQMKAKPTRPTPTPIWFPYSSNFWLFDIWSPAYTDRTNSLTYDRTVNLLHGYEAARNPVLPAGILSPTLVAGMPVNDPTPPVQSDTTLPQPSVPTFDQFMNTLQDPAPISIPSIWAAGSPNLNEADEMPLYASTQFDAPYGPVDLEWLYRQQDTDGVSLASRLQRLAPISFVKASDSLRRRRLFCIDTWETNGFVWANDNPANDPQLLTVPITNVNSNSNFAPTDSANLSTLSFDRSRVQSNLTFNVPVALPSVAHRDRKINLNFPLPASNRYDEPVRQKWIRETYQLLKAILPPKAIDTPEELAQLSQFVINIIDFRDPDCTATRFVNTDLYYDSPATVTFPSPPSTAPPVSKPRAAITPFGMPAVLAFTPPLPIDLAATTYPPAGSAGVPHLLPNLSPKLRPPFSTTTAALPPPYSPLYDNSNSPYLVQYGMEYNPVAITEVLGFQTKGSGGADANQLYIELLNTLKKPATDSKACDLELEGWDFVIMPDDPTGRPDPYTGQLPYNPGATIRGITLTGTKLSIPPATTMDPPSVMDSASNGLANRLEAVDTDGTAHPYVFYSQDPAGVTNSQSPFKTGFNDKRQMDLTTNGGTILDPTLTNSPSSGTQNNYYWLYLRRPANPFDVTYDAMRPNENRVVVDCFRFMFNSSRPTDYSGASPSPTPADGDIYSLRRLQPFRGGHAVPPYPRQSIGTTAFAADTDVPKPPKTYCLSAYGYSEQGVASQSGNGEGWAVMYGATATSPPATGIIYDSLGKVTDMEDWDYFPFHDRDFTSVSELLMVPGCPPGLFTKQFVEDAPPIRGTNAFAQPPRAWSPTADDPYQGPSNFRDPSREAPHTFPYLMDEFFYTAQSEPLHFLGDKNQFVTGAGIIWPDPGASAAPAVSPAPIWTNPDPNAVFKMDATYPVGTFPLQAKPPAPLTAAPLQGTAPNQSYPATYASGTQTVTFAPNYIGGPSGAGWYKMLEFFEVPSPAMGAIGPVTQGSNYDWARQDLKPGLLNINLIVDEEVFFAVMSESWMKTLNYLPVISPLTAPYYSPAQADVDAMGDTRLNVAQIPLGGATPQVVTQVLANGLPTSTVSGLHGSYSMANVGFTAIDPYGSGNNPTVTASQLVVDNRMKAAFSDFLKLRHGGSGFMFAHQYGLVGDPSPSVNTTPLAAERPFRSLSYPDINYTIMRPAALPPTTSMALPPYLPTFGNWDGNVPPGPTAPLPGQPAPVLPPSPTLASPAPPTNPPNMPFKLYIGDPGVRNPFLFTDNSPVQPPPIPARRLFEVPDYWGNINLQIVTAGGDPATVIKLSPPGFPIWDATAPYDNAQPNSFKQSRGNAVIPSNASSAESTWPPTWWNITTPPLKAWLTFTGDPNVNWQNLGPTTVSGTNTVSVLFNPDINLAAAPTVLNPALYGGPSAMQPPPPPYVIVPNHMLGGNTVSGTRNDNRQHPAFRYEWLQKVANLTTVRTHQYAVWITVGFFEVTKQGDPSLGTASPTLAYDHLGQELNIQNGKNIRYRSFFIVDRTRATGFSPQAPGDFRDCIVYRQSIE